MNDLINELAETTARAIARRAKERKNAEKSLALQINQEEKRLRAKTDEWVRCILADLPRRALSVAENGGNRMFVASADLGDTRSGQDPEKLAYFSALRDELNYGCEKLGFRTERISNSKGLNLYIIWPEKPEA